MTSNLKTALNDLHHKHGAKCVSFASYQLPIWYTTMQDEHLSVRNSSGMFDISHMGLFELTGSGVESFLQTLSCNAVTPAAQSKMVYSMFLNDKGMILDDVMFGKLGSRWHLVVNGANQTKLSHWMNQHLPPNVSIRHLNSSHSFIAIQGPEAARKLQTLASLDLSSIPRFGMADCRLDTIDTLLCRTGYTGEDGFECMIANDHAPALWTRLLDLGVTPCGLAARDSLRIEYGLPLYGQELSESIHPLMTRYAWVVKNPYPFIGKEALTQLKSSLSLKAVGLELDETHIARPHYPIAEGGKITSGTISPLTGKSIALAFVPLDYADLGSRVTVRIRKRESQATVVSVPFV